MYSVTFPGWVQVCVSALMICGDVQHVSVQVTKSFSRLRCRLDDHVVLCPHLLLQRDEGGGTDHTWAGEPGVCCSAALRQKTCVCCRMTHRNNTRSPCASRKQMVSRRLESSSLPFHHLTGLTHPPPSLPPISPPLPDLDTVTRSMCQCLLMNLCASHTNFSPLCPSVVKVFILDVKHRFSSLTWNSSWEKQEHPQRRSGVKRKRLRRFLMCRDL